MSIARNSFRVAMEITNRETSKLLNQQRKIEMILQQRIVSEK